MADKRALSDFENSILKKMFSYDFTDKASIADQIAHAEAEDNDDKYGSVTLVTSSNRKSKNSGRVPIELESHDSDGVPIAALLHVVNGFVNELEFYKADGSPIKKMPSQDDFYQKSWDPAGQTP